MTCPVCGFGFGAGTLFWGIVGCGHEEMRGLRWPKRRRTFTYCPECQTRLVVAQQTTPTVMELALL